MKEVAGETAKQPNSNHYPQTKRKATIMGKKHSVKKASTALDRTAPVNHRLFHYTVGWERIASILTSKLILREFPGPGIKTPVAWFSTNPKWENTVKKGLDTFIGLEYHASNYGAFRVEVRREALELHSWKSFIRSGGESKSMIRGMNMIARAYGANPSEWYCCRNDVPVNSDTVIGVGIYHDGQWHDMPVDEFKSKYEKELNRLPVELLSADDVAAKEALGYRRAPAMDETLRMVAEKRTDRAFTCCAIGKVIHCLDVERFSKTEDGGVVLN